MSPEALIWIAVVFLFAGYARGLSGFGFSAVTVAGLSFVVSPVVAVSTAIVLEVFASLVQARSVWQHVDWRRSAILLLGGLAGTPMGVFALAVASEETLKAAIYCFLLTVILVLTVVKSTPVRVSVVGWFVIAFLAGIVNGATAMSGLFIVAVMTAAAVPPERMRATLVAYIFFADFYAAGLLGWSGLIGAQTLWLCVLAAPLVVIGIALGSRKFARINEAQFRRATLGLLSIVSVAGLAKLVLGF